MYKTETEGVKEDAYCNGAVEAEVIILSRVILFPPSHNRTGSVSSEDDGEDWPTSPIVAVCEQFVDE